MNNVTVCPCGSHQPYQQCCGRFHEGETGTSTAEALMRSRYSAYVLGKTDFLLSTWHKATRPEHLDLDDAAAVVWLGLEILGTQRGGIGDDAGMVEFIARYRTPSGVQQLHERSRFVKQGGQWYYLDGEFPANHAGKPGRNNPCPCGSGKKYKRCCGS